MSSTLGQRIADEVVGQFGKLNVKSGLPTTRSNGVSEWTVLAGLVAIDGEQLTVLSLATGVKAMPDDVRVYSAGTIVHDMHAEILCLRMFNWYLMEEVKNNEGRKLLEPVAPGKIGDLAQREGAEPNDDLHVRYTAKTKDGVPSPRFRLKPSIKLALYISEPPCGDASMSHIASGQSPWENEEHIAKKQKLVRGRANFSNLGVVRTKPGRPDSKISYSKSCSDKLCVKQVTGILNCINSLRIEPIFLDYLVLQDRKYHAEDFSRCFGRVSENGSNQVPNVLQNQTQKLQNAPHPLQVLTYTENNYKYEKHPDRSPSALSVAYCGITRTSHVLNNGVKNGAHLKNRPPKPHGPSALCRRSLWVQARAEIPAFSSYRELKRANGKRESLKKAARDQMGSWPACRDDDFAL